MSFDRFSHLSRIISTPALNFFLTAVGERRCVRTKRLKRFESHVSSEHKKDKPYKVRSIIDVMRRGGMYYFQTLRLNIK